MPTIPPSARHDLTDAEWTLLAPLLPAPSRRGRPRTWGLRSLVNDIFFRIRTGCPWRDVPERYGPWWRIYDLFIRLNAVGVWESVHTRLLAHAQKKGQLSWEVSVDSTTIRGHVHANGARKDSPTRHPGEPAHHSFGRSRGGWSTKIYVRIDVDCGAMFFIITPGQTVEGPQMVPVLEKIWVPSEGVRWFVCGESPHTNHLTPSAKPYLYQIQATSGYCYIKNLNQADKVMKISEEDIIQCPL